MKAPIALTGLLLCVIGCSTGASHSQPETGQPEDTPSAYLPNTTSRIFASEVAGRTYQISVALPRAYEDSGQTYPVLYALDANGQFGTVVESARLMRAEGLIPDLLVVGIGYPVGFFFDASEFRATDLTPTVIPGYEELSAREDPDWPIPDGTGRAGAFLSFIRYELIPYIESEYRADPGDRSLFGHSYAGLFALHVLLQDDQPFQQFVIGSPSLWWDNRVMFERESAYAAEHYTLQAKVFFSFGTLEPNIEREDVPWGGDWVADSRRMAGILESRDYEELDLMTREFVDEYHTSVIPATISRGLRFIYSGR